MAEQEDALGSNPGSSKEYEFDSHQGDHHNERRTSMRLRLTDYNDNTYMDTALDAILWSASDQSSEEKLNKALSWALVDKTA